MAGIAGIVDLSGRAATEPLLGRMLSRLQYEPSFQTRSLTGPGWGLGQVWLGQLPGTRSPVRDESGRWHLALDGEVENLDTLSPDTAGIIGEEGQARRLLRLVAQQGVEALTRAEGNFAIAVWDQREQTAFLLSDRLGLRPLYYAQQGRSLLWASKVRPLLEHPDVPVDVNPVALAELLAYEYVLGDKTLVRAVSLLPPATLLTCREGQVTLRRYWRLQYAPQPMTLDEAIEAFVSTLERAVDRAAAAPAKVGVPLSGGVDSRTLLALIDPAHQPVDAFTFGFPWSQDVLSARQVARRLGAAHHVAWSEAAYLPQWAPQGVRNTDGMVSCRHYHICQIVPAMASRVNIALDGIGGGLYRGESRVRNCLPAAMDGKAGNPAAMIQEAIAGIYNTGVKFAELSAVCHGPASNHLEEASRASLQDVWRDSGGADEDVRDRLDALQLRERIRRFANHGSFNVRSRLEVRMPYLSAAMIELHRRIPAEIRWSGQLFTGFYRRHRADLGRVVWSSTGKPVLAAPFDKTRRRLARLLALAVRDRRTPADRQLYADYASWFRGELSPWVHELLLGPSARSGPFIHREAVERLVAEHRAGPRDRSKALGALVTFELWCRDVLR